MSATLLPLLVQKVGLSRLSIDVRYSILDQAGATLRSLFCGSKNVLLGLIIRSGQLEDLFLELREAP